MNSTVLLLPFSLLMMTVSLIYFYMFYKQQDKALTYWGFAWMLYSISLFFILMNISTGNQMFLEIRKLIDMCNVLLLLFGLFKFVHIHIPTYWLRFTVYLGVMSFICMFYKFDLISFYLPISVFQLAITFAIDYHIVRYMNLGTGEKLISILGFTAWGVGIAVFSLLEFNTSYRVYCWIIELLLSNILNFGLLSIYVQSIDKEAAIKNSAFEDVFTNLREVVFYYELKPRPHIQYVTPSIQKITGYTQDSFYDNPETLLQLVELSKAHMIEDLIQGILPQENPTVLRIFPKKDQPFWARLEATPVYNQERNMIAIELELQDINEMQAAQLEQIKAKESRDKLLSYISHELRTPVTSIAGYLQAMRDGILTEPEEVGEAIDIITTKTTTLRTLISDLDQLSKLETGEFSFNFMMQELQNFSEDIAMNMVAEIRAGKYEPAVFGLSTLPKNTYVIADAERIQQVVDNLVSNAIKYSVFGTNISIAFRVDEKKRFYAISVSDEGPGIKDADIRHLFDRFYRANDPTSKQTGRGLGLTLSKEIMNSHKGTLEVYNNKDRGCTFTLTIPLYEEEQNG